VCLCITRCKSWPWLFLGPTHLLVTARYHSLCDLSASISENPLTTITLAAYLHLLVVLYRSLVSTVPLVCYVGLVCTGLWCDCAACLPTHMSSGAAAMQYKECIAVPAMRSQALLMCVWGVGKAVCTWHALALGTTYINMQEYNAGAYCSHSWHLVSSVRHTITLPCHCYVLCLKPLSAYWCPATPDFTACSSDSQANCYMCGIRRGR
jgi:hypothetical protein